MDKDQNRIDELNSRIADNKIELKQIYQTIGERAAVPGVFSGENDSVIAFLDKLSGMDSQLEEIDAKIDDLRNSFNRIDEIASREKEIGEEYSELEKQNSSLALPVGKAVYVDWKNNRNDDFPKLMEKLEEQENIIIDLETEIYKLANDKVKKNLINKIKDKSRIVILTSKKKANESSMNSLYSKTGEKAFKKKDISFFQSLNDESVSRFIANRKTLEKLDRETEKLKEENSRLEKHLKSKFSSSRQKKAEEKLHSERDFIMSGKMAELNNLGTLLYAEKLDFGDKEIKSLFEDSDEIHDKNNLLVKEIEVRKAELEIVKLDEEIDDMKNNIKDLEITIEKSTGDIAEFNKEIKRARAEIRKLKKLTDESTEKKED